MKSSWENVSWKKLLPGTLSKHDRPRACEQPGWERKGTDNGRTTVVFSTALVLKNCWEPSGGRKRSNPRHSGPPKSCVQQTLPHEFQATRIRTCGEDTSRNKQTFMDIVLWGTPMKRSASTMIQVPHGLALLRCPTRNIQKRKRS